MRLRFGLYTLDSERRQLIRARKTVPLSPKAFNLLEALAEKSPAALSKEQIHRILWPGEYVLDGSLHNLVSEIRRGLRKDRDLLRTVPRYGYALEAETERDADVPSNFCIVMGQRVFALRPGENILGRGPEADVPIEVAGVSRKHARITVTTAAARIEDLGSKNGTFVGKKRVTNATTLQDGDQLFLGRTLVIFRLDRRRLTTATEP